MNGLIFGLLSQDATYMAELLHSKGYLIYGVVKQDTDPSRLSWLKISIPDIIIFKIDITNPEHLRLLIRKVQPDEIYNFAAVSDVINPMNRIAHTLNLNGSCVNEMLYAVSMEKSSAKFFQASSRLVFGEAEGILCEKTPRMPSIPYAAGKQMADEFIKEHRQNGIFCCSGIFFNHESERRPEKFFTRSVSTQIAKIVLGMTDTINVGNVNSIRDFGYAPEYVEAAWMMLQDDEPIDYVIGSGSSISTGDYISMAIEMYDIQRTCQVMFDNEKRVNDAIQVADYSKIRFNLAWEPKTTVPQLIKKMVDYDILLLQKQTA